MNTKPLLPEILSQTKHDDDRLLIHLKAQAELAYFDGHFPEAAILPGVVQIHWAEKFARLEFPDLAAANDFKQLEAIKFQQLIKPGQELFLELDYQASKRKLYFRFFAGEKQFSTGRFAFGES